MKIGALVDDLFFRSKIAATAKEVGADVTFCSSAETVPADAEKILIDLNATAFDPVEEIRKLQSTRKTTMVAFLSHVQVELKQRAEAAGATDVIPRSVFTQRLAEILKS
jgi:CheY-like chemotaxis protein